MIQTVALTDADIGRSLFKGERIAAAELLSLRDAIEMRNSGDSEGYRTLILQSLSDRPWRNFFVGESYHASQAHPSAIFYLMRSLGQDPTYKICNFYLAESLEAIGLDTEAGDVWADLVRLQPQAIQYLRRKGTNLLRQRRLTDALAAFSAILGVNAEDVGAIEKCNEIRQRLASDPAPGA